MAVRASQASRCQVRDWVVCAFAVLLLLIAVPSRAQSIEAAQKLLRAGNYAECAATCDRAIASSDWRESWWLLKIRAELATGLYAEALKTYESGLPRQPTSVQIRLIGYDVLRANDRP